MCNIEQITEHIKRNTGFAKFEIVHDDMGDKLDTKKI